MGRQSISFTEPNDEWLKSQVEKREYASKSELVNDLIRQARGQQQEINYIRMNTTKSLDIEKKAQYLKLKNKDTKAQ